jgi:hypothetical protein
MKKVRVIYGYKGSGKDTCVSLMMPERHPCTLSFADELRKVCWMLFENKIKDKERLYGAIDKKEEIIEGWLIPQDIKEQCGFEEQYWTGRRILQWMGTDVCRKVYSSIWVDKLIDKIKITPNELICITDCRFLNEYEALKKLNSSECDVQFIEVVRDRETNEFSTHASEKDLKHFKHDCRIYNNCSLDMLKPLVLSLV